MRELPLTDLFAKEKIVREIKEARDIEKLRKCALDLLELYYSQKRATNWVMEGTLAKPATIVVSEVLEDQPVPQLAPKPTRPDSDMVS